MGVSGIEFYNGEIALHASPPEAARRGDERNTSGEGIKPLEQKSVLFGSLALVFVRTMSM